MIAPIDLNEDGKLEIICQILRPDGKMDIKIIYNNVWLDSFFLKSMMIYDHVDTKGNTTTSTNHYGDVVIGSSFRFVTTKLSDEKIIVVGS